MKYLFYLINTILITAIAYFCVGIAYKNLVSGTFTPIESSFLKTAGKEIRREQVRNLQKKGQYDKIIERNLFKVELEGAKALPKEKIDVKPIKILKPTTLNLVLWGTVTGASEIFAVIEDKKARQQFLYEVGDEVQGARLKQILRHKVILNYQGMDQVLEMKTEDKNIQTSKSSGEAPLHDYATLNTQSIGASINDMGELTKQIKIRPHFTQGESDGLMVYGIKPNSVFMQMGLKNGDIVREINGTPILSPGDVSNFYTQIKETEGDAKLTLFRRGKVKTLFYQVENGAYTIAPFPGEEENKGDK